MIDTHIHIDEEAFAPDREEVIARQRESGVEAMIVPGVNVASIETVMEVCHAHPNYCYPALGLHPEDVKEVWEKQLVLVEQAIREHRHELVAIGEIGLDYYWDKTYKEEQKEVLRRQLRLAQELDLPVILHNREATEDILKTFGIGGVITFKNCKLADCLAGDERFAPVPLDRLLLETDGPYMAPVPHRGQRNESRFMIHVAERLAQVYNEPIEQIIVQTNANTRLLFSIK